MESIFPGFPTAARASYVPCTSNAQTSSVESRLASGTNRTEMHRVSRRYPACSLARPDTCGCPGVAPGRLQLWKASYPTVYFCSEIKTSSQRELRSGSVTGVHGSTAKIGRACASQTNEWGVLNFRDRGSRSTFLENPDPREELWGFAKTM